MEQHTCYRGYHQRREGPAVDLLYGPCSARRNDSSVLLRIRVVNFGWLDHSPVTADYTDYTGDTSQPVSIANPTTTYDTNVEAGLEITNSTSRMTHTPSVSLQS